MTIAACHVSPEGVVLGADSTTTILSGDHVLCHFDHAQKLFEVGAPGASIGLLAWGLGQVGRTSHRLIAARVGAHHERSPFRDLRSMAEATAAELWSELEAAHGSEFRRARELFPGYQARTITAEERRELDVLDSLSGGYCLGGRVRSPDQCEAFDINWRPWFTRPDITAIPQEVPVVWGIPGFALRLAYGFDPKVVRAVFRSGLWNGTLDQLEEVLAPTGVIVPTNLPLRDAIDWIHTLIYVTIRGLKFAQGPHTCGGPIEIAAISNDRPFRWVQHKGLDSAVVHP